MQRIQYSFRDDDTGTASRIDAADGLGMCLCSGYLAITIQFSWIAGNSFSKFAICFLKGAKVSSKTAQTTTTKASAILFFQAPGGQKNSEALERHWH